MNDSSLNPKQTELPVITTSVLLLICVLIGVPGPGRAEDSRPKPPLVPSSMGGDPYGSGTAKKQPTPFTSSATDDKAHQEKLEMVRRIVEDVEGNDVIPYSAEDAATILRADLARRVQRQTLIQSMDGMGSYLAEIASEKLEQENKDISLYLLEMSARKDIASADIDHFIKAGDKVLDSNPGELSAFQAALLGGIVTFLKAHPAEGGKAFLLRLIESRPEAGFKLKAAQDLAIIGDSSLTPVIEQALKQAGTGPHSNSYQDVKRDIQTRLAELNRSNHQDRKAHSPWAWAVLSLMLLGLLSLYWQFKRRVTGPH